MVRPLVPTELVRGLGGRLRGSGTGPRLTLPLN